MDTYDSQIEASERIPQQWRTFRLTHPALGDNAEFYGASPCTDDHRIHILTGVGQDNAETAIGGERMTLVAGEYAVVRLNDAALLRDTWTWLLGSWLPTSGRREKNAPEFERFTSISEAGMPVGPVEIWITLEPLETLDASSLAREIADIDALSWLLTKGSRFPSQVKSPFFRPQRLQWPIASLGGQKPLLGAVEGQGWPV
jgi:predicted transcriptional regulator YdeE